MQLLIYKGHYMKPTCGFTQGSSMILIMSRFYFFTFSFIITECVHAFTHKCIMAHKLKTRTSFRSWFSSFTMGSRDQTEVFRLLPKEMLSRLIGPSDRIYTVISPNYRAMASRNEHDVS